MTIIIYIIRIIVALILGISFVATVIIWHDSHYFETRPDIANYISLIIFILFAYLLWVIK